MSRIEKLIQELCPKGIESYKLNTICIIKTGKGITQKDCTLNGKYPVISGGQTPMGYYNKMNRPANMVTISRVGAYAGFVNYITQDFYLNDKCFSLEIIDSSSIESKFLYYSIKNRENDIINLQSEGGVPTINTQKVGNIEIPVPPLEIQEEIVRILDKFTDLTAELQAELQGRIQQYDFYRNRLLTYPDNNQKGETSPNGSTHNSAIAKGDVKWMRLDEIAIIKNGKDYKHLKSGNYPVYGSGGIMGYIEKPIYSNPSVLIPRKGSLNNLFYVDKPFWNVDTIFYTEIKTEIVVPKFLYYALQVKHLEKLNHAGGVPSLTQSILNKVILPIPSLEEQERIVSILDKFDTLLNDLKQGLPAEIEALQQQYEYYRDKLLTFERAN